MNTAKLARIEKSIQQLSLDEQLWLIEQMVRRVRATTLRGALNVDDTLAAMAADPEIQRELRAIEQEFAITELDGLEGT